MDTDHATNQADAPADRFPPQPLDVPDCPGDPMSYFVVSFSVLGWNSRPFSTLDAANNYADKCRTDGRTCFVEAV